MSKALLLATIILLTSSTTISAESAENITKRRPDRPETATIQEIREQKTEAIQERKESRANLANIRSNVAENHANRLEKRFSFYFDRLTAIIVRFNTRLDSLNAKDPVVINLRSKLTTANTKLIEAKTKGDEAVDAFRGIDPSAFSEQKAAVLAARDMANSARKLFVEVHVLLKEAIKTLKTISKPALPASSAAVQNNNI